MCVHFSRVTATMGADTQLSQQTIISSAHSERPRNSSSLYQDVLLVIENVFFFSFMVGCKKKTFHQLKIITISGARVNYRMTKAEQCELNLSSAPREGRSS